MTEQEALAKMISPSMKRPHIWRQGVLQIHVTRACDKACFGCTQGSNLGGKPSLISVEGFEQAVLSIKGYFGVVGMFGGNPCMHPKFDVLCEIMRKHVPYEQRGLWSNKLLGKGAHARKTFNPKVSNLNVHLDRQAYDEFWRDWPEARSVVKGHDTDSRHSPPHVAMIDVEELTFPDGSKRPNTEENRWELIGNCDINQNWSSMIAEVPGKGLRAYFCEIAGGMALIHAEDPDWPDTGIPVTEGWWRKPMQDFVAQTRHDCHRCGVPLRRYGQLAVGGEHEECSQTHERVYKPKDKNRRVELVTLDVAGQKLARATDYIQNGSLK